MIHVDSFFVFLFFWKKTELPYLSHFNARLNHVPSVDAMLHRCKALPEALLSRTCTVLGCAECSCEVVHAQSWSRVIVVSVAIDFSVVPFFLHIFAAIFWQLFNWLENRPVSLGGEASCWPFMAHHGAQPRVTEVACEFNPWIQNWSVYTTRHVLTSEIIGIFHSLRGFDYRTPWEFWNQRCPCLVFFSGRPYVGPTSPLTGVWSQTWSFLTFGLKVAKNKPNLPQVGLEKDISLHHA